MKLVNLKKLALAACLVMLPACDALRVVAPQTVAGFEAGGVLGALDGASGAILARCRTLDGQILRVAVDNVAVATGTDQITGDIRAARVRACNIAGAVHTLTDVPAVIEAEEPVAPI